MEDGFLAFEDGHTFLSQEELDEYRTLMARQGYEESNATQG